jgi:hypothetical protein
LSGFTVTVRSFGGFSVTVMMGPKRGAAFFSQGAFSPGAPGERFVLVGVEEKAALDNAEDASQETVKPLQGRYRAWRFKPA